MNGAVGYVHEYMKTKSMQSLTGMANCEEVPELGILILYEDFPTGMRAKASVMHLMSQVLGVQARFNLWGFGMLGEIACRQKAAEAAAEARIVIVSAHGYWDLPDATKALLDHWLDAGPILPSALVVSLDEGSTVPDGDQPNLESVLTQARQAGLDVFPHTGKHRNAGSNVFSQDIVQQAGSVFSDLRKVVSASCSDGSQNRGRQIHE